VLPAGRRHQRAVADEFVEARLAVQIDPDMRRLPVWRSSDTSL
jgi:hypothetical protein